MKLETTLSMSSRDHPQSDGQTERVNQIIEDMLPAYVATKPTKWCILQTAAIVTVNGHKISLGAV
jgi:hypothetical protein